MDIIAMSETATSAAAPAASRAAAASALAASALKSIGRRLLALLQAHARRQIELVLGERVAEFNQAIRTGAAVRRRIETQTEDQQ